MTIKVGDRVRRLSRWATSTLSANEYKVDKVRLLGYTQEIHLEGGGQHVWWYGDRFATLTSMSTGPTPRMEDHKAAHRANDRDTAVAAATCLADLSNKEARVLEAIRMAVFTGMTGKQIAASTGIALNTVTPRLAPLRRRGCIKDSGQRRDRQIVWVRA